MPSPLQFSLIATAIGLAFAFAFWKYRPSQIRSVLTRHWKCVAVILGVSLSLNNPKTLLLDIGFCFDHRGPSIDLSGLEQLLKAQNWQDADLETGWLTRVAAGTEHQFFPTLTTVDHLPCADLQAIDRLWVKYSQGKFGYSVQQKIYRQAIDQFGKPEAQMQFDRRTDFDKKTLSLAAPAGHLPSSGRYLWTNTSRISRTPSPFSTKAFAKRQDWCGD